MTGNNILSKIIIFLRSVICKGLFRKRARIKSLSQLIVYKKKIKLSGKTRKIYAQLLLFLFHLSGK